MQPLARSLRNDLEKTVKSARDIAENAAKACLEQLGVGESVPFSHLSDEQKNLRRRLRAHGRQLGDIRSTKGEQEITLLLEEVAYEHWHRMLFARFLADNNLLMFDGVAVTLAECAELAADEDEGFTNEWEMAADLAGAMLPQIFRTDSVVFKLHFSPEHQRSLERLIADLPVDVFMASDSLGWVYQFWQSKRKDEVNTSEVKIGARELPAVTQLFTEPYMVAFLLDNTLGSWWASRKLTKSELSSAKDEDELRRKASLPGVPLSYLRFVKSEDDLWTPAAGTFLGWPRTFSELKILDPSCGSGHFLVAALQMLVPMRMELEKLSVHEAIDKVLTENLHGLEIDQRCVEIAAFALALTAWRYPSAGGYRTLPELNVASTGLSISSTKEQWMAILEGQHLKLDLRFHFEQLYNLFTKAPTLGSLINPHRFLGRGLLDESGMRVLMQVLRTAIKFESTASDKYELGVVAAGLTKAAELLAERYTLVVTNVPYLGRGKQDDVLKKHLETQYPLGKADLATAFVLRCLEFCTKGGSTALVTPQNWLFLTTYKNLRETLLRNRSWEIVARLGAKGFQTPMWDFNIQLSVLTASKPVDDQAMSGIDVSEASRPEEKAALLRGDDPAEILVLPQKEQLKNPDARVLFELHCDLKRLGDFAESVKGITTGDSDRFIRRFWEVERRLPGWEWFQSTVQAHITFGGCESIVEWHDGNGPMNEVPGARTYGRGAWGSPGVVVGQMARMCATLYQGTPYDNNACVLKPTNHNHLPAIWAFATSPEFVTGVRVLDQKVGVTNATFEKLPFDLDHWQKVAAEKYPSGLPEPESDDPTQWLFHGRPENSFAPLQVAVARLLGYRWPAELDANMRLSNRASKLANSCAELGHFADSDGIVCIPPVRGEAPAVERLLNLLALAYGQNWGSEMLSELLKAADHAGKTIESWLRNKFFIQHCQLFHQRPFIWHIWDGLPDGFSALVNYHKLDRKNMETLIYTYLGDWITRQRDEILSNTDGAQERLAAAETLKQRLELILQGDTPYDIFVRWKPLLKQPIGWEPDLNDGVRVNIRPFMTVPDIKKKGAGVLREKPRIDWKKDRGKEPVRPQNDFPWFWGWDETIDFAGGAEFTGDRYNNCHYSLDVKRRARRVIRAEDSTS
ncbi:Eco57I restriction-modification methylase domain-containing protein [Desulfomicrobium baculatum]|uniref:site-specific DNA-methyltransferase (adenine-specific) n=1 Tax=Desulfomicrobium baculatum (strain DSM 4028 / VKM B-1378 / X) TaxID=525897 RepID=C7LSN3_DESBD|nr:DNA methyltransferase [Desulfomicrobium baculatum]ACU89424.1 conserved hypothetical protein [Desulfomicrobium baculatum DSM 4028]